MQLYRSSLFLFFISLSIGQITLPMEQELDEVVEGVGNMGLNDAPARGPRLVIVKPYDSDSEDEDGYTYRGLPHLTIPEATKGKACIALSRGIHFVPANFNRKKRSAMRRANDAGKDIYCSAAYDLAGKPLDSDDTQEVKAKALEIREQIKQMVPKDRNTFQQIYSNNYDGFHARLGTNQEGGAFARFTSKKNPQVSTSEDFPHSEKYGYGLKYLGKDVVSLDPEYDGRGKPKHPYLGKLFVILAPEDRLDELAPYFVVHGHANDCVTISYHFSKNVLSEREASNPGLIPGDCVALSIPLRVPSFKGAYKPWYEDKFGISNSSYLRRQKMILAGNKETVTSLIEGVIIPYLAKKMKQHIVAECAANNVRLVYKQLDGSFGRSLPDLVNATAQKKLIADRKRNQRNADNQAQA